MKNVEDDPAMTPGSVVRSPLSLTVIKDTDMLAGKTSPPPGSERSLSSSTWTYPPPASTAGPLKPPADAWGASKSRTAPPQTANKGWPQHHNSQQRPVPTWQASTWLLLKNLTAQVILDFWLVIPWGRWHSLRARTHRFWGIQKGSGRLSNVFVKCHQIQFEIHFTNIYKRLSLPSLYHFSNIFASSPQNRIKIIANW